MENLKVKNDWLYDFARNVHSQRGEDGIIEKIFDTIKPQNKWFVEFGAWDGIHLSNTRLLAEKGWSGVFIEASEKRFNELKNNYKDNDKIV